MSTPRQMALGYWDVRGRAEPIRMVLNHANIDFEDVRYPIEASTAFDLPDWYQQKSQLGRNLGLDFPNLPYLVDGDVALTQGMTILRYLGRKFGLCPRSEADTLRVELVEQVCEELRSELAELAAERVKSKARQRIVQLNQVLNQISTFLADSPFVAGNYLTCVDFLLFDTFILCRLLKRTCLAKFINLRAFFKRIKRLPNVRKYLKSQKYKKSKVLFCFN